MSLTVVVGPSSVVARKSNYNRANDVVVCVAVCVGQPTPKTADVTITKIAGYFSCPHPRESVIFFRIFGIHSFYATATLLNI